jgi:hypothetical protein
MKLALIPALSLVILMISCGKDKFKTEPQIEIKDINKKTIGRTDILKIQLRFTDKEGDLAQGKFVYIPIRLNQQPLPPLIPDYDSVRITIPSFPNEMDGDFMLELPWINLHKSDQQNDSIFMRFVVVDRAGHKSDTINSDRIVILKN